MLLSFTRQRNKFEAVVVMKLAGTDPLPEIRERLREEGYQLAGTTEEWQACLYCDTFTVRVYGRCERC